MEEKVILVDRQDNAIGTCEKLLAHKQGLLHRAISIIVINDHQELMLHKRAEGKYHSGGLWTNTCCTHPRPGEDVSDSAHRRLKEEMGFDCPLDKVFDHLYQAHLDNDLIEHEFVHVYLGRYNGKPQPNPSEVEDWQWVGFEELKADMARYPEKYTVWFRKYVAKLEMVLLPATSTAQRGKTGAHS